VKEVQGTNLQSRSRALSGDGEDEVAYVGLDGLSGK